jgi:Arc/MetJ family transcription regulator
MRATITIPDDALAELMDLVGTTNRTEAINTAIHDYVVRAKLARLAALRGRIEIADNDEIEAFDAAEYRGG